MTRVGAQVWLWLSLTALACTTGTRSDAPASGGAGGSSPGLDASTTAGNESPPGEPSDGGAGAGGSDAGSAPSDSAVPDAPIDSGTHPADADADADAAPGALDAAEPPPDAATQAGQPQSCPPVLPEFDAYCFREGLSCQYGMECCPDLAFCEYGRWTLLTHHCDACP